MDGSAYGSEVGGGMWFVPFYYKSGGGWGGGRRGERAGWKGGLSGCWSPFFLFFPFFFLKRWGHFKARSYFASSLCVVLAMHPLASFWGEGGGGMKRNFELLFESNSVSPGKSSHQRATRKSCNCSYSLGYYVLCVFHSARVFPE